jgi:cyclopropane-fatty-acyl-phospholipid synthase
MNLGLRLAEHGRIPELLLRRVIRARHSAVLRREDPGTAEGRQQALRSFLSLMHDQPVAPAPDQANRQHYEVPAAFFEQFLGPWLKYSSCLWPEDELGRRPRPESAVKERSLLGQAEESMLGLTAERAEIQDGMTILDLGCGWGSFSLWAAEGFPASRILAVSNSRDQGQFIQARAAEKGLENLQVMTADMNGFQPPDELLPFDRILSVEMFEHLANWPEMLRRIRAWLTDGGRFFMHIFAHRELVYPFRSGPNEWMSKHFFAGGIMPADDLILHLQQDLTVQDHWRVSGLHYARTLDSWLALLQARRAEALQLLNRAGDGQNTAVQFNRWRLFLMACSELFGYRLGNEWIVSHYLLSPRSD